MAHLDTVLEAFSQQISHDYANRGRPAKGQLVFVVSQVDGEASESSTNVNVYSIFLEV